MECHPDGCEATGGPCSGRSSALDACFESRGDLPLGRGIACRVRALCSRRWPDCFGRCIGSLQWSLRWQSVAARCDAAHTGIAEKLIAGIRCPKSRNDHYNRAISNVSTLTLANQQTVVIPSERSESRNRSRPEREPFDRDDSDSSTSALRAFARNDGLLLRLRRRAARSRHTSK